MAALQELRKLAEVARKPGLQAELADRFDRRGWTDREGAPTHALERRQDGTTEAVEISAKVPWPLVIPGFTFENAETDRGLVTLCCHTPYLQLCWPYLYWPRGNALRMAGCSDFCGIASRRMVPQYEGASLRSAGLR